VCEIGVVVVVRRREEEEGERKGVAGTHAAFEGGCEDVVVDGEIVPQHLDLVAHVVKKSANLGSKMDDVRGPDPRKEGARLLLVTQVRVARAAEKPPLLRLSCGLVARFGRRLAVSLSQRCRDAPAHEAGSPRDEHGLVLRGRERQPERHGVILAQRPVGKGREEE